MAEKVLDQLFNYEAVSRPNYIRFAEIQLRTIDSAQTKG